MSNSIIYIQKPTDCAKMQLLCIPYAGGTTRVFDEWPNLLSDAEVLSVAYPGRGARINEKPIDDVNTMLKLIVEECKKALSKDFAIFGHSMGSILAYALAAELEKAGIYPKCLFVSAAASPSVCIKEGKIISQLPDDELVKTLADRYNAIPTEVLNNPKLMNLFVPLIRSDIAFGEQYIQFYNANKQKLLVCDIVAFGAKEDWWEIKADSIATWVTLTSGNFEKHMFPGTHFYIYEYRELLLAKISRILSCYYTIDLKEEA